MNWMGRGAGAWPPAAMSRVIAVSVLHDRRPMNSGGGQQDGVSANYIAFTVKRTLDCKRRRCGFCLFVNRFEVSPGQRYQQNRSTLWNSLLDCCSVSLRPPG